MTENRLHPNEASTEFARQNQETLRTRFDAVVVLTMGSNWKTEPRSNRYHYASRFARHLPVIFVQMTGEAGIFHFESTEITNLALLHLPSFSYEDEIEKEGYIWQLGLALRSRNVLRPLFWIYDFRLATFLRAAVSELSIFHATEDYTIGLNGAPLDSIGKQLLQQTLAECDGLVAVSEAVRSNYERFSEPSLRTCLASNGCDFSFFKRESSIRPPTGRGYRAIYQGGINFRLDLDLLLQLANLLPTWEFRFLGRVAFAASEKTLQDQWNCLVDMPNVKWMGEVDIAIVREEMTQATVGLIPFRKMPLITVSMPLKAYEYVACGLPVVTVPIDALQNSPTSFCAATTAAEFADAMQRVAPSRYDSEMLKTRISEANANSYDHKFDQVLTFIEQTKKKAGGQERANVLILFDPANISINYFQLHLISFSRFSRHDFRYAPAVGGDACSCQLFDYDAVVLHFCIPASGEQHLSPSCAEALMAYPGLKILFTQGEHDPFNVVWQHVEKLGIQIVYADVSPEMLVTVYPASRLSRIEFVATQTLNSPHNQDGERVSRPVCKREQWKDIGNIKVSLSEENPYQALIQGFEAKLQEYGIGTKRRPSLAPPSWYLVPDDSKHGYHLIKSSEIDRAGTVVFPCPATLGAWEKTLKAVKNQAASVRRIWNRLPHPAKAVLRPPWRLVRCACRFLKSLI